LIVVGVIGALAAIKRFFGRLFGRSDERVGVESGQ